MRESFGHCRLFIPGNISCSVISSLQKLQMALDRFPGQVLLVSPLLPVLATPPAHQAFEPRRCKPHQNDEKALGKIQQGLLRRNLRVRAGKEWVKSKEAG